MAIVKAEHGRIPHVWGKVPQRNMNFTGREDLLSRLREGITMDVTAVLPHALHGIGGVGKTQLAVEYAYRYQGDYELVWWISADQPLLVRSSLAALAPHLKLPSAAVTGIEDASAAVLDALRRGEPYSRWLLIFDNADQPEDINEIIPRGPGHVLITSRNHRWEGVVDTLAVDVFDRAESVEFLNRRVPKAISTVDAGRLADELGDLPLALEQAGALQAETGMSVDEYLRLLTEKTSQLLAESKPSEYPLSMTAAWSLSVERLKEQLPEAVELLRCCAFFGAEPIPRDVFRPLSGDAADVDEPPAAGALRRILGNPILLSRAIRELGRFALARIDSPSRTIQVHRLIQALIRDELTAREQARYRGEVHLLLAAGAPLDPDDTANWPRYADLLAHVTPALVPESRNPAVRRMALDLLRYLFVSGGYQSARAFAEQFLQRWRADSGPDHPDVLAAQRHLGDVLRELGEYREAYDLNSRTLEQMTRVLGPDHPQTLVVTNIHAADLRARGDFAAALEVDEEARRRHEAVLGPVHPWTLNMMNNLAVDHGLMSRYQRARELHEDTYLLQQQNVGVNGVSRTDVLSSWNGLSRVVRLCGDYPEARDLGEDAHAYGVQELGAEHPWTLRTAKDLSIALRRTGRIPEAIELARDILSRYERIFGKDHPDTLAAAMSLANALRSNGDIDDAFHLAEDTLERYPAVYGADHPYRHGCAGNLAVLRRVRGDVIGARDLDRASLAALDARLSRDHHYSLTIATNLATDLVMLGEMDEAVPLRRDTLERLRTILGREHPVALAGAANLVADLYRVGAEGEAKSLSEETLDAYARTLGPDHPDTRVALEGRHLDLDFDPPPI
ncbi:FxSxx-COOH system tetratricopeptide repeat protein [Streptosporangium sp. NPDC004379]|uniref:FxSxx-COOH system tetratricopeptide repeat protein n=1 Tax=Streptosporangium sp. NPDC004379 TaxID=3366189 RepID=UPI00369F6E17